MFNNRSVVKNLLILVAVILAGGIAINIAIAQTGSYTFSLNSPASFPVDI